MAGCRAGRLSQREALVRRHRGAAGGSEGHGGSGLTRAATPSVGSGVGAAAAAASTRQRDELGRRLVGETGEIHQLFLAALRSEEHTSELQSLMRNSYAVFCLKKKNNIQKKQQMNL